MKIMLQIRHISKEKKEEKIKIKKETATLMDKYRNCSTCQGFNFYASRHIMSGDRLRVGPIL